MHFRISALEPTQFSHLFHLSEKELASQVMMLDADVVDGKLLKPVLQRLFNNGAVEFLHLHNARRGCYAARVDRELE
jgi:hypothetical protein